MRRKIEKHSTKHFFSLAQVIAAIISQAIIIIQFKINENKGKPTSGYRSGWNMEGLMENKILVTVTQNNTWTIKN